MATLQPLPLVVAAAFLGLLGWALSAHLRYAAASAAAAELEDDDAVECAPEVRPVRKLQSRILSTACCWHACCSAAAQRVWAEQRALLAARSDSWCSLLVSYCVTTARRHAATCVAESVTEDFTTQAEPAVDEGSPAAEEGSAEQDSPASLREPSHVSNRTRRSTSVLTARKSQVLSAASQSAKSGE